MCQNTEYREVQLHSPHDYKKTKNYLGNCMLKRLVSIANTSVEKYNLNFKSSKTWVTSYKGYTKSWTEIVALYLSSWLFRGLISGKAKLMYPT